MLVWVDGFLPARLSHGFACAIKSGVAVRDGLEGRVS